MNPIKVVALQPLSCGSRLWRMAGVLRATVMVKATYALTPDREAWPVPPIDLVWEDRHRDGDPARSLEAASEVAPYLPTAGVLLTGHAHAPGSLPATATAVRLTIFRDRPLLEKTIHVFGDRTPLTATSPRPFQQIPIVYERAYGGSSVPDNPAGVGAPGSPVLANLVDPADRRRPAGFGPIAPAWGSRAALAGPAPISGAPSGVLEIPDDVDWKRFHAAPADQQIPFLSGDEWILLDGLHPALQRLQSRLPSARAQARWHLVGPGGASPGRPIDLFADTLVIDADRQLCSVVWRGRLAVPMLEGTTVRVFVGVELPDQQLSWPEPEDIVVSAEERAPSARDMIADEPDDETTHGRDEETYAPSDPPARRDPRPPAVDIRIARPPEETTSTVNITDLEALRAQRVIPFHAAPPAPAAPRPAPAIAARDTALPAIPARDTALPFVPAGAPSSGPPSSAPRPVDAALPFVRPALDTIPEIDAPSPESALPFAGAVAPPPLVAPPSVVAPPPLVAPPPVVAPPPLVAPPPVRPLSLSSVPSSASPVLQLGHSRMPPSASSVPPPLVPLPVPSPSASSAPPLVPSPVPSPSSSPAPPPAAAAPELPAAGPADALRATVLARLRAREPLQDLALADADLQGIDFSDAYLVGVNLKGARLTRCVFAGARLADAQLAGADLSDADLTGADLSRADLTRAILTRARLDRARLPDANLTSARGPGARFAEAIAPRIQLARGVWDDASFRALDAPGADLTGASLDNADFQGATLVGVRLDDAHGAGVTFDGARLSDASANGVTLERSSLKRALAPRSVWEGATLTGSTFEAAELQGANLSRATCAATSFEAADLTGANLQRATGDGAILKGARLEGADLRQARLRDASFEGAILRKALAQKADLTGCRLARADLNGAALRAAKLKGADLSRAALDGADLRDADLEGADLRGAQRDTAKLSGANTKGLIEGPANAESRPTLSEGPASDDEAAG